MKIILKILAVPFMLAFGILGAVMKFLCWVSGGIFALAALILGIGGAGVLFSGDTSGGIALLVMAFLVSPFGIPAIAQGFAGFLDEVNYSLKGFIAG